MSKIKVLSADLVNKIAAGEVIERPSSLLKELVENSIDANAKNITIIIEKGGKSLIKVIDDGTGMSKEDLQKCLLAHSTSKMQEENLFNIKTLGFRGEALASIAAVANVNIASIEKDTYLGYEISSNNLQEIKPHSIKTGTSIKVSGLFYNTPARLKFLKSDAFETTQCYKMLKRLALSNPDISFKLESNNKIVFNYIANKENYPKQIETRVQQILGKEFIENAIYVEEENPMFKVYGFIGYPTFSKNNSDYQYIIINSRSIKDKIITGILKFAYSEVLFSGKYPCYSLFIDILEQEIDVNVNPTKSEVRFKDSQFIRHILLKMIKEKLGSKENQSSNSFINNSYGSKQKTNNSLPVNLDVFSPNSFKSEKNVENINFDSIDNKIKGASNLKLETENIAYESNTYKHNQEIEVSNFHPLGFAKAQFHKNWIIAQSKDGLVIIDQHAAHERITQEKLKKEYQEKRVQTQLLLTPDIIELDPMYFEIIKMYQEQIISLGIEFDIFGNNVVLIKATPSILGNINSKEFLMDILSELEKIESIEIFEKKINEVIARMACHGSIRSGKVLSQSEMNDLLRQMENTPNYAQCSHGRPTFINLSLKEIEKLFKRS